MELAFIVYCIGILPGIAAFFGVTGGVSLLLLLGAAFYFTVGMNSWDSKETIESKKAGRRKALRWIWLPLLMILFAKTIPSEKTMYTMVVAYAGQAIAETPQAQQIGNDAVDVLHELLAKAKRELKDDEPKKEGK